MGLVYLMVIVGGLTRLTDSGLSMVDWRPLMGTIPPITESQWIETFEQYRQSPEYLQINKGMSLDEFKYIFYWEYGHRVLGRLLGLVFFIPFVYFLIKRRLALPLARKLGIAFLLGGTQGLLGWYMVKSGLVDVPHVSQYRLAAHLSLAFFLLCYLYWLCLSLLFARFERQSSKSLWWPSLILALTISLQIVFGALTAGLDAGKMYNTFPDMNGYFLPPGSFAITPIALNFFENPVLVQWTHRTLAWAIVGIGIFLFMKGRIANTPNPGRRFHNLILAMISLQFLLGVGTLVLNVPLAWASLHQAGAGVLLLLAVTNLFYEARLKFGSKARNDLTEIPRPV